MRIVVTILPYNRRFSHGRNALTSKTVPKFSIFRIAALVAVALFLPACKQNAREPVNPQTAENQPAGPSGAPSEAITPLSTTISAPDTIPIKRRMENALLKQAQHAFSLGYFTSPAHNNAYDKFQSVLLINPQSEQARAGIQAILLKYAQLTRLAISEGRLPSAKNYLRAAEIYYPANPLLMDLKQKIRDAEAAYAQVDESKESESENKYEELTLAISDLNRKSESLQLALAGIAKRVEESQEGILIFARSDREGRWIYKQLKDAVPGYRVRGDIRISKSPKIRILPPY